MEPASPKGGDLRRGSGYALHASVADTSGSNGEFQVLGFGQLVEAQAVRHLAIQCAPYTPLDRYILFDLTVERVMQTLYTAAGRPKRTQWSSSEGQVQ
jgi:hypothetical protein